MRLIDADALSEHKFVGNKFIQIGGRRNGKTLEVVNRAYQQGWNDAIDAIIDNAPTVDIKPFVNVTFNKDELEQIVRDKVIEPIKNGELVVKSEWILINERLPDYMDDILITFQKPNREPLVYRAVFVDGKFNLDNGDVWNWNDPEVKAWMPLPEAYKEAEND